MTSSHVIASFDSQQMIYNQGNYIHRTYLSTSRNQLYLPLPIPSIDLCENLLYETKRNEEDLGSSTSSSYINSSTEHYDNTLINTYNQPIQYHESYTFKQSLINIPDEHENFYDNTKDGEINPHDKSSPKLPVFFYLENKRLAVYVCFIFLLLLIIIASGIFLLNKFIPPVVIQTTVNHHYDTMNISNLTTTIPNTSPVITTAVVAGNLPFPYSTCPSDRWGITCQNICKPCGLGVCHSVTGKCICPVDIYGEFCDLWKVNDQPKRGDMMS